MRELTDMERQVIAAVADGDQDKQIARRSGLSYWTVRERMQSAMKKLGAKNRAHAVTIAMREGLIA